MSTKQLRAEVERLRGEISGYHEHISQMADVQTYDRNLIKALSAEIARLEANAKMLWNSIAEKNKEILRLHAVIKGSAPQQPMTGVSRSS